MAMYDAEPIPTRRPIAHPQPPHLVPGDPVRLIGFRGDLPAHAQLEGAFGRVLHVTGQSVVIEMDEPYMAAGLTAPDVLLLALPAEEGAGDRPHGRA